MIVEICVALLFLVSLLSVMCSAVLFTRPHCYTNSQYMWMITDKWCAWSNLVRHSWQFSGKSDTINREMKSASEFHGVRNSFLNLFLCLIHLIISKISQSPLVFKYINYTKKDALLRAAAVVVWVHSVSVSYVYLILVWSMIRGCHYTVTKYLKVSD